MTTFLPLGKRPSTLEQNRLNNNGRTLFEGRYLMSGETIEDAIWRVASNIANAGNISQPSKLLKAHQYYNFILSKNFMPNSPTFFGAGTPLGQLSACYVVPIEDSLDGILKSLRDASHITKYGGGVGFSFSNIRSNGEPISTTDGYASGAVGWLRAYNAMFKELQQGGKRRGAFMGILNIDHPDIEEFIECKRVEGDISMFNLSIGITDKFMGAVRKDIDWNLVDPHSKRIVKTVKAVDLFNRIVEGSHRNGEPAMVFLDTINRKNANIHRYVLEATNPCVTGDTLILTENGWIRADSIVGVPIKIVTDQRLGDSSLKQTNGTFVSGVKPIYEVVTKGGLRVKTTLDHKYMTPTGWKELQELATGSTVHINRKKRFITESYTDVIESITYVGEETVYDITEPVTHSFIGNGFVLHNCGEQPLESYNSCNLGSINLANFVSDDGILQQQELENAIRLGVQFLNDVLDVNNYVDLVPELKETALATRRIGLGVMGYWSMLVKLGFSYGSEESNRFTEQLANFFFYTAFSESIKIAGRTKPYPLFKGSQWSHLSGIANITPYTKPDNHFMDIGFTPVALDEMQALRRDAQTYGVANSAILTVAPTGTISTIIGETGGIEPEFALVYVRHWLDGMDRRQMTIVNPLFRERVEREIPDEETRNKIYDLVGRSGTCQNIKELSDECKRLFRVSNDLTPIEHLGVQIAWQKHIDSAISKTINCPSETTIEQMAELYHLAHKNGLKGVTFYRTGSRDMVVLETIQTLEDKKQHNVCELCGSETKVAEGCETCMNPECGYSACSVA